MGFTDTSFQGIDNYLGENIGVKHSTQEYKDHEGIVHKILLTEDEVNWHIKQVPSKNNCHYSKEEMCLISTEEVLLPDGALLLKEQLTQYGFTVETEDGEIIGYVYPNLMFVDLESHNNIIN